MAELQNQEQIKEQAQNQTIEQLQQQIQNLIQTIDKNAKIELYAILKHVEDGVVGYDETKFRAVAKICTSIVAEGKTKNLCFKSIRDKIIDLNHNDFDDIVHVLETYKNIVTNVVTRYNNFVKHRQQLLEQLSRLNAEIEEDLY